MERCLAGYYIHISTKVYIPTFRHINNSKMWLSCRLAQSNFPLKKSFSYIKQYDLWPLILLFLYYSKKGPFGSLSKRGILGRPPVSTSQLTGWGTTLGESDRKWLWLENEIGFLIQPILLLSNHGEIKIPHDLSEDDSSLSQEHPTKANIPRVSPYPKTHAIK
jgi:hypothetical protein